MAENRAPFHVPHFLQPPTTELSHFLLGDNQLQICNGCNPSYKKGVLIKDLGYSIVGSTLQSGKSITGLHHFHQTSAIQKILATVNNSGDTALQLFYSTGGSWTELTDAETAWSGYEDAQVEMEDFIGYCFFVGYDATDDVFLPNRTLTGTTFGTTLTTSMPGAKYIKRYRDRLYVANCYNSVAQPYRVYFSSVPSAGSISWTVASDFFDVDYSESITGIETNWDRLVIFTDYSAYLYDQDSKKEVWDVGCSQHRSIQNIGQYMIWANKDTVLISSGGGFPVPIGADIQELIRQSSSANWRSAVVDREYVLYLGSTSANGLSYSNCMATYNLDTGMWRWRELADVITELARVTLSGKDYLYMGANDGDVHVKSKYTDATPVTTDNTAAIKSHFRTKAYDFGDPSILKHITKTVAYAESGLGLVLYYRLFNKKQEGLQEFQKIGVLDKIVNEFPFGIDGYFIQFEGREMSGRAPWRFHGFTALFGPESRL